MTKQTLLIFAILISSTTAFAQKGMNVQEEPEVYFNAPNGEPVCYEKAKLKIISEEMYAAGNEKYIWVDLLIDNLIPSSCNNSIMLFTHYEHPIFSGKDFTLTGDIAKQYSDKFMTFATLHGYNTTAKIYNFKYQDLSASSIFNTNSDFRTINSSEQSKMLLTVTN